MNTCRNRNKEKRKSMTDEERTTRPAREAKQTEAAISCDDRLTPDMMAAVMTARGRMFDVLEAEFPGNGAQLYAVACSGGTCDLLRNVEVAPMVAQLIEEQLMGTPYALSARRAN
jgi:hypothetical protein